MSRPTPPPPPFLFLAERLWLDFVNTEMLQGAERIDLLADFGRLMAWSVAAGLLSARQADQMALRTGRQQAARSVARAVRLRRALRRIAERCAAGAARMPPDTVAILNEALELAARSPVLVRAKGHYVLQQRDQLEDPREVLVAIARSAAELLVSDDRTLVRKCQNPACILFFFDTTRNHARRWCSMTTCGNRAKVAAHYRRAQQGRRTSTSG